MTPSLALLAGVVLAAGLLCLVVAVRPATPRLSAALDRIQGGSDQNPLDLDVGPVSGRSESLGALVHRWSPVPLTEAQRRALRLQDKSVAEFYADKAVMAVIGVVLPSVAGVLIGLLGGGWSPLPAAAALVGGLVGYLVPDLLLRRSAATAQTGATEALLTFVDLVTLERLANASATQALHHAAELSDVPLFTQIRTALDRARLEQQSPYAELRRLAAQLKLPELADLVDVMQLDDAGAALSGSLRARVRELRDAHLTREQIRAAADAEGMTIFMTLPALVFGLIFLVAALLRIVVG